MGSAEVLDKSVFISPTKFATKLNLSNKVLSFEKHYSTLGKAFSVLETTNDKDYSDGIQGSTNEFNEEVESSKRFYQVVALDDQLSKTSNTSMPITQVQGAPTEAIDDSTTQYLFTHTPKSATLILEKKE